MSPLGRALIDSLDDADLAELARRLGLSSDAESGGEWLTAKQAADHLGLSVHAIRRLAADPRSGLPVHQEREGCKLWFKRSELDRWRS